MADDIDILTVELIEAAALPITITDGETLKVKDVAERWHGKTLAEVPLGEVEALFDLTQKPAVTVGQMTGIGRATLPTSVSDDEDF